MGNGHEKAEDHTIVSLNWRFQFRDRVAHDPLVGPARMVDIAGRCTDCWGEVVGQMDANRLWIRLECRDCRRRVDAGDAEREAKRMTLEAEDNIPRVRVGRGAVYHEKARFVLKILPDMDRDKVEFEKRVDNAKRKVQPKPRRGRLTRRDFSKMGSPGSLYLQACALVSGLGSLPREMSAISLSDFDLENPRIDITGPSVDAVGRVQMSAQVPRKPSNTGRMVERMGTAMIAGFSAAFACEVGMKAILMTRLDEAEMTHDLLALYKSLPEDCRERLQADFAGIADILEKYRHAFGDWRYFDSSGGQDATLALVDTDRIWGLRKAARVIVDEGVVGGLQYDIDLRYDVDLQATAHVNEDLTFTIAPDDATTSTKVSMKIGGHESAIPWGAILSLPSKMIPAGRRTDQEVGAGTK